VVQDRPVDQRPLPVPREGLLLADGGDQVGDRAAVELCGLRENDAGTASTPAAAILVAAGGAYSSSVKPIQASSWSLASRPSGWAAEP
jgi:hypothetical protein